MSTEIKSLNKDGRPRHCYWRPVKNKEGQTIDWMSTLPLPADYQGKEQYLGRGFKMDDPRKVVESPVVNADQKELTEELYAEIAALKATNAELSKPKIDYGVTNGGGRSKTDIQRRKVNA